jgi:hypothetical protein
MKAYLFCTFVLLLMGLLEWLTSSDRGYTLKVLPAASFSRKSWNVSLFSIGYVRFTGLDCTVMSLTLFCVSFILSRNVPKDTSRDEYEEMP